MSEFGRDNSYKVEFLLCWFRPANRAAHRVPLACSSEESLPWIPSPLVALLVILFFNSSYIIRACFISAEFKMVLMVFYFIFLVLLKLILMVSVMPALLLLVKIPPLLTSHGICVFCLFLLLFHFCLVYCARSIKFTLSTCLGKYIACGKQR